MCATAVFLAALCGVPGSIALTSNVPALAFRGATALLDCNFWREDPDTNNVTWYKDGVEFFRWLESDPYPGISVKDVPGIEVDIEKSGRTDLTLKSLKLNSGGDFRCVTSSNAKSLVSDTNNMLVVAPPETDPVVSGLEEGVWVPNGTLQLNCTAGKSSPSAELMWFVDGGEAAADQLTAWPTATDEEGLQSSKLGLALQLGPDPRKDIVKVTCEATVRKHFIENGTNSLVATDLFYKRITTHTVNAAAQTDGQLTATLLVLFSMVAATLGR